MAAFLHFLTVVVRRRFKLLILLAAVGTGLTTYFAVNRQPSFTAEALILLEPTESRIVDLPSVAASLGSDITMIETQLRLLESPEYLTRVAEQLGLLDAEPDEVEIAGGPLDKLLALVPKVWLINYGLAQGEQLDAVADPEAERFLLRESRLSRLKRALTIAQEGRSLVISVSATTTDSALASRLVNALADVYVQDRLETKLSTTRRATDWLDSRLTELKRDVEIAEQAVESYRGEHKLLEGRGLEIYRQQVSDLTNMLVASRTARSEKEARLKVILQLKAEEGQLESATEVLESAYLSNLWQQQAELQRKEAELRALYGERHPQIVSLSREKENIALKMSAEVQRLVENINNEIAVLTSTEQSLQADIDAWVGQLNVAGQAEVGLRQLERQADANRRLYEEFLDRSKQIREQQDIVQANARIIARAHEPTKPSSLPAGFLIIAGFLISSVVGLGLSWLLERLNDGVRSGKEIESEFGLPCFAMVPFLRRAGRRRDSRPHRYLLAKPLSAYTEAIRSVVMALRLSDPGNPPKVIQVASAAPGEGKTVFAVSLSTLLARNHATLLIDLDLRHPSVHREIAVRREVSLAGWAAGEVSVEDLIERDAESNLDVIGLRDALPDPPTILTSQWLRDLLQQLRWRYEYIIVDGPPILGVSDSKLISEFVDTVVLVAQWETTTFDMIQDSLKALNTPNHVVSGVVLTQVNLDRHASYGYGGSDDHYKKHKKYYQN